MADRNVKRRLAAILAADVAGYTRLMEADTDGTVAAWQDAREDVIKPCVSGHSGTIVKLTGDGFLVEFPTVQDAVNCAINMQEGLAASSLDFRMGVNMGDIVDDGEDIHGEGVNIAARLESLADPGGISISGMVYDTVRNRIEADYEDRGEQDVKNVSAPVRVYAIRLGRSAGLAAPFDPAVTDKPSIAVLPFDNLSDDADQEYFSDGITEDIITGLSRIRQFLVIARNSTFTYKGQAVDVQAVAADLGVRYVLEGSVRKSGARLRISVQLIDGETGNHIWAERYEHQLEDIFDIQDEITAAVIGAIAPELSRAEQDRARKKSAENLDGWDYFQRGMWHFNKMSTEDVAEARRLFEKATARAPEFAGAHAALGYVAAVEALAGYTDDRAATLETGLRGAERAVALDDRDSFNQFALGRVAIVAGDMERARGALEKAIQLNPSSAQAHYGLGVAHFWAGQAEDALPYLDQAIRLSPYDPQLWSFHYLRGNARFFSGDRDGAIADQKTAIQNKGDEYLPHLSLAFMLGQMEGRGGEAHVAYEASLKRKPELSAAFLRTTLGNLDAPMLGALLEGLKQFGLPAK